MEKNNKKKNKKKRLIIVIIILAAAAAIIIFFYMKKKKSGSEEISDYPIYDDTGEIDASSNYFAGVIEPEESKYVDADSDREIDEVFVSQGDSVHTGDQLFSYKTKDVSLQIEEAKLELEGYDTTIADSKQQITDLTAQKAKAVQEALNDKQPTASIEYQYDSEIQSLNTAIKQAELSKKKTKAQIDDLNRKVANTIVTSPIDGTISNISTTTGTGGSGHFITILSSGSYRVKGTVDEMNVSMLSAGMPVIIHSRVDDTKTWTGSITKIETDSASNSQSDSMSMYGYGVSSNDVSSQGASKYTFYASLDTTEDLLLGQHVYVEIDFGTAYPDDGSGEGDIEIDSMGSGAETIDEEGKNSLDSSESGAASSDEMNTEIVEDN